MSAPEFPNPSETPLESQMSSSEIVLPLDEDLEEPEPPVDRFFLLVRHGIAEERSEDHPDHERKLTKKGAQRVKDIGKGLAEVFPRVDAIYTSPLVRALQTGAYLAKGYRDKIPVRMSEALEPGGGAASFKSLLESIPGNRWMFVGHEPDLTHLLGALCGLDTSAMELKKGGCYGVRIKASGDMRLEWMLHPGALRRISK